MLDRHSAAAAEWFEENVTGFAREFSLMSDLIRETGLRGEERVIFLLKLDLLYQAARRRAEEEAKENAGS